MVKVERYRDGILHEIEHNGETVFTRDDYIRRNKISDQSREELVKDIQNGDFEAYARKTFEILTGETVEEAKK